MFAHPSKDSGKSWGELLVRTLTWPERVITVSCRFEELFHGLVVCCGHVPVRQVVQVLSYFKVAPLLDHQNASVSWTWLPCSLTISCQLAGKQRLLACFVHICHMVRLQHAQNCLRPFLSEIFWRGLDCRLSCLWQRNLFVDTDGPRG